MKDTQGSGDQGAARSRKRPKPPDIQATEDLMSKLMKVPKKELDAKLAEERNAKPTHD